MGAAQTRSDVLLFLHADCRLDATAGDQVPHALEAPEALAGAFRQRIEASGRLYRLLELGNAWRAEAFGVPYGDQGLFWRRSVFEQLGGFPDVPLMEDLLLMRTTRRLARPVLVDGPLYVSAQGAGSNAEWSVRRCVTGRCWSRTPVASARSGWPATIGDRLSRGESRRLWERVEGRRLSRSRSRQTRGPCTVEATKLHRDMVYRGGGRREWRGDAASNGAARTLATSATDDSGVTPTSASNSASSSMGSPTTLDGLPDSR